jgi:hypothetical protein
MVLNFLHAKKYGLLGAFIGGVIFTILPILINDGLSNWEELKIRLFTDVTDVVQYHEVVPTNNPNPRKGELFMRSYVTWYQAGWDVEWNDVLFCEETGFQSSQVTNRNNHQPGKLGERDIKPWVYTARLPNVAKECYIEATITVCNIDDICLQKTIDSTPIYFK